MNHQKHNLKVDYANAKRNITMLVSFKIFEGLQTSPNAQGLVYWKTTTMHAQYILSVYALGIILPSFWPLISTTSKSSAIGDVYLDSILRNCPLLLQGKYSILLSFPDFLEQVLSGCWRSVE